MTRVDHPFSRMGFCLQQEMNRRSSKRALLAVARRMRKRLHMGGIHGRDPLSCEFFWLGWRDANLASRFIWENATRIGAEIAESAAYEGEASQ